MQFAQIIGRTKVKQQLTQQWDQERIGHAILLEGQDGSGHLELGLAMARYMLCSGEKNGDVCGTCPNCQQSAKLAHPDLHLIYPIAKTKDHKNARGSDDFLPVWRELFAEPSYVDEKLWIEKIGLTNQQLLINAEESNHVIEKLSLKSYGGKAKVMVIWKPEKMNASAANKLLKILEEPPALTHFIVVSCAADQLLPTIISRLQRWKVDSPTHAEVTEWLQMQGATAELAAQFARIAHGNIAEAGRLLHADGSDTDFLSHFTYWMRGCYAPTKDQNLVKVIAWTEEMHGIGRERQKQFLQYCSHLVRQSLLLNYGAQGAAELTDKEAAFLTRFSPFIHEGNIMEIVELFDQAMTDIERNASAKITLLDISLKLMKLLRIKIMA